MKTIVTFTVALSLSLNMHAQWNAINLDSTTNVVNVHFTNSQKGFIILRNALGDKSELLGTSDGGETWIAIFEHSMLSGMDFLDNDKGAVIGNDTVFATIDGGSNWNIIPTRMEANNIFLFKMLNAAEWLYVRGQRHGHTYDGGKTWIEISLGNSGPIPLVPTDMQFISEDTVVGVGWYGNFTFMSPDKGNTWKLLSNNPFVALYSVCLPTSKIAYAGTSGGIIKSTDGGVNWNKSYSGHKINCVRSVNENIIYAVGDSGVVLKTIDGGNNWVRETSGTKAKLNKIFLLQGKAIIIGDGGTVLINNSIPTTVSKGKAELFVNIFPVPVASILMVEITSPWFTGGKMDVYDASGKNIGYYDLTGTKNEINVSAYQEGTYFYNVRSEKGLIKSGKFIKVK